MELDEAGKYSKRPESNPFSRNKIRQSIMRRTAQVFGLEKYGYSIQRATPKRAIRFSEAE
jgi:hypothetical protein